MGVGYKNIHVVNIRAKRAEKNKIETVVSVHVYNLRRAKRAGKIYFETVASEASRFFFKLHPPPQKKKISKVRSDHLFSSQKRMDFLFPAFSRSEYLFPKHASPPPPPQSQMVVP